MGVVFGVDLTVKFRHQLSGVGNVEVEICPHPLLWPLPYTTACTRVQAVIQALTKAVGYGASVSPI